jgi:hypothetical protein
MTPEKQAIQDAAWSYVVLASDKSLANLMNAVTQLPIEQWPSEFTQLDLATIREMTAGGEE